MHHAVSDLRLLFCATFLCRLLVQKLFTNYMLLSEKTQTIYLLDGDNKDGDYWWTYLFNS